MMMEVDTGNSQERSSSHVSRASLRSHSSPVRNRGRSRQSSSLIASSRSSLAESDKSLTSFPSLPPESPPLLLDVHAARKQLRPAVSQHFSDLPRRSTSTKPHSIAEIPVTPRKTSAASPSIVESLVSNSPVGTGRAALFDDTPVSAHKVPGSLHLLGAEHINRVIARHGAVPLLRQFAEDLAHRDAQIALLRRRAEERERALKKIILECGLTNMDLEKRLRVIEEASKIDEPRTPSLAEAPLEDLLNSAMGDIIDNPPSNSDATIRAAESSKVAKSKATSDKQKGWFNSIWGGGSGGTVKKPPVSGVSDVVAANKGSNRKTVLRQDIFDAPLTEAPRRTSLAAETQTPRQRPPGFERKISASIANMVRLVAGSSNQSDTNTATRGRASSAAERMRAPSLASMKTNSSSKNVASGEPHTMRRKTLAIPASHATGRPDQDRWNTMTSSPVSQASGNLENYGPVEMDAILPPETQPPAVTQLNNNNQWKPEFLTDRYGFIYDQRRKKRQREAIESMKKTKRGNRLEMLSDGARGAMSPSHLDDNDSEFMDERPDTPVSLEEIEKPKRWQDYLKIATSTKTELLSSTPFTNTSVMEIMEAASGTSTPGITTEERGFLPTANAAVQSEVSGVADNAEISKPADVPTTNALTKEDVEPVKLLLSQLSDVHDAIQQARTLKWNDFLRKVRAERRREGEAAAAALAADATSRRGLAIMQEATMADGEMIGVAGLGVKGKVGRNKATEFKGLVLGGIPVTLRAKIWAECSGALAMRIPGNYEDLVASRVGEDDPVIVAQIQMDIHRTLTDNIYFRRGPGVTKLTEVLLAYSRRNTEVGYCQGMNLITACLLLIMPTAEDAFWLLCTIIETILPQGYYDHSLLASRADQQVLRQYVSEILPRLSAHLEDLAIELEALTFQWFLSVFTDCLSAEALFRVWDVVLCINDGSTFLFQVALALLKLNEQELLECDSPAGVYTYINHQMTNHAISIDGLIQASEGLRKVVKREDVEVRRAKAIKAEGDQIRIREARNNLRKKEKAAAAIVNDNGDVSIDMNGENGKHGRDRPIENESRRNSQLEIAGDEFGEMTIRTPIPMDEEVAFVLS